jgi:hypothetical protein
MRSCLRHPLPPPSPSPRLRSRPCYATAMRSCLRVGPGLRYRMRLNSAMPVSSQATASPSMMHDPTRIRAKLRRSGEEERWLLTTAALAVLRLRSIGPIQTPQLCSSTVNRFPKDIFLSRDKHRMATRVIKLREAEEPAPKMVQEVLSQSKRPEVGRFLLQVDRQTKGSYATAEAAEKAGMVIKKGHPIVRVSVYDSVETANKIIELPAGSPPTS